MGAGATRGLFDFTNGRRALVGRGVVGDGDAIRILPSFRVGFAMSSSRLRLPIRTPHRHGFLDPSLVVTEITTFPLCRPSPNN